MSALQYPPHGPDGGRLMLLTATFWPTTVKPAHPAYSSEAYFDVSRHFARAYRERCGTPTCGATDLQRYPGISPGDIAQVWRVWSMAWSPVLQRYPAISPGDIVPSFSIVASWPSDPDGERSRRSFPGPSNPMLHHYPVRHNCLSCNGTRASERYPGAWRHLNARRAGAARDPRPRLHREREGRAPDPETGW